MTIEKARTARVLDEKYDDIKEALQEAEKAHDNMSNGIFGIDIRFDGDALCAIPPKIAVEALDLIIRRLKEKRDEIQREIEEL